MVEKLINPARNVVDLARYQRERNGTAATPSISARMCRHCGAALSEGERDFSELAIVADTETLTPPCGTCRQIIWEFAKNAKIILSNLQGETQECSIKELLPRAFDARFLSGAVHKD